MTAWRMKSRSSLREMPEMPKKTGEVEIPRMDTLETQGIQLRGRVTGVVSVPDPKNIAATAPGPTVLNFRVARALALIEAEYTVTQLNLDVISRRLGVTKHHLCRIFRRQVGVGLPEYVCRVRAAKAEKLLQDTSLSIKEITAAVGFAYVTQLDRSFKTLHGCSPKEYRSRLSLRSLGAPGLDRLACSRL